MSSLLTCVERALAPAGLFDPPDQTIVAAVSGGPDSLALLHLLHALSKQHPWRLHAAHLDHGLRGAEGAADAAFVKEICRRLGVPFHTETADVLGLRVSLRISLEAAAREARYAFLARVASQTGASAVATGHTQDDQAETVLLHLLRGSGLRGLRGMLPLSRWRSRDGTQQATVVRPLLEVTRQETEAFCQELGLAPRRDASNAEERFVRNRLRLTVLPQLQQLNPSAREALTRLAASASRDLAYLYEQVDGVWHALVAPEGNGLRIGRIPFLGLHPSLQAHLLYRAYAELAGEAAELTFGQIEAMMRVAAQGAGREVTLGHGLRLFTTYQKLLLTRQPLASPWPAVPQTPLPASGEACIQGWQVLVQPISPEEVDERLLGVDPYHAYLDADAIGAKVWLKTRQAGDRFQALGMKADKRLKEFMIDAHIPRQERAGVPLVACERGIAWVVGWRIAHWARVTPETRRVLAVTLARE
ncbi:MAG: tRNA lysidine(34) synthetase TilS [Chloroflexi bacterium]|nr:tRNA lysidine(34) synthetase TilS [Chloroflexota bacterium]